MCEEMDGLIRSFLFEMLAGLVIYKFIYVGGNVCIDVLMYAHMLIHDLILKCGQRLYEIKKSILGKKKIPLNIPNEVCE